MKIDGNPTIAVSIPGRDIASGITLGQWAFAVALRARGHQVRCLVPTERWMSLIKRILPAKFREFAIEARASAQAKAFNPRFVLAQSWCALWHKREIGIPVFHGCYGLTFRHARPTSLLGRAKTSLLWWLERRAARRAPVFICVSQAVAQEFGLSTARVCLNGIDLDRFTPALIDERRKAKQRLGLEYAEHIVLMAGRLSSQKRLDAVLKIPPLAERLYLVCIPDRDEALAFSEMCSGRQDILIQSYPQGIPEDVWNASDALYMPSRYEGCSLLWMEAAARGIPPIATLVGHLPQIAADDSSLMTLMLDPVELDEAPTKIAAVLNDLVFWRAKSRMLAERYHDIRRQGEVVESIISELIG